MKMMKNLCKKEESDKRIYSNFVRLSKKFFTPKFSCVSFKNDNNNTKISTSTSLKNQYLYL